MGMSAGGARASGGGRRRRGGRRGGAISEINVTPLVDVMLVLLVIFMVTAPLVAPGEIQLPTVGSKLTVPQQPLEVTLRNGALFLRDRQLNTPEQRISREDLVARALAKQQQAEQPVVIAADRNAKYDDVLAVLDALQRSGVRKVGLLARPPGV
jgi:biopolymer transport protein TolR